MKNESRDLRLGTRRGSHPHLECGDSSPLAGPRESGDESPHSKGAEKIRRIPRHGSPCSFSILWVRRLAAATTPEPRPLLEDRPVIEIPATPQPLGERIDKLERENRNLLARLDKLEKRSGAVFFEVVRTSLLLVVAAVLLHLMGLLPGGLERVSLAARHGQAARSKVDRLEVKEVVVQDRSQASRAKIEVRDDEAHLTFLDAHGHVTSELPVKTKP